jgi:hypothetical protein
MQVTINGRRLALGCALLLAGALAPIGYSALGKSSTTASRPVAVPAGSAAVATPQAPAAVADSPYQAYFNLFFSVAGCYRFPLPDFQDFVLESVVFQGDSTVASASVQFLIHGSHVNSAQFAIPLETVAPFTLKSGGKPFNIVVRPRPSGVGNLGEITGINICVTGPLGVIGEAWATGQRIGGPTAVRDVVSFAARPDKTRAVLRWSSGTESSLLGFNVWRYRNGKGVKVNRTLVRAKRSGEPAGASYSFVDARPGARRGLSYRLQLVDVQGKRTWYAAFAIPA